MLKKPITRKGWWSGSRCRPWVQAPVLKKKKKRVKKNWQGWEELEREVESSLQPILWISFCYNLSGLLLYHGTFPVHVEIKCLFSFHLHGCRNPVQWAGVAGLVLMSHWASCSAASLTAEERHIQWRYRSWAAPMWASAVSRQDSTVTAVPLLYQHAPRAPQIPLGDHYQALTVLYKPKAGRRDCKIHQQMHRSQCVNFETWTKKKKQNSHSNLQEREASSFFVRVRYA
jgi:hypothetical protein